MPTTCDAVVIGGGFYGVAIALYLREVRGLKAVTLCERSDSLLTRASYHNQARIHNGYHYPRSYQTAYRSRINLPRFIADFHGCIYDDFTHLYAIARHSKVSATQFRRFCGEIGARLQPASPAEQRMFDGRLIEQVFRVEEMAFNAVSLRRWAEQALGRCGIGVAYGTEVTSIRRDEAGSGCAHVLTKGPGGGESLLSRYVFNCTYSGLQSFSEGFDGCRAPLKHEIAELALVQAPEPFRHYGITVMDGPFFSMTPFPSRGIHTLSHVRYTPHFTLSASEQRSPYRCLEDYPKETRFDRMKRDASRYMPGLSDVRYEHSLFEVKTVLVKNEVDDGRPILFERHATVPGCYSILGGKLDNIYDIYARLDAEAFTPRAEAVAS